MVRPLLIAVLLAQIAAPVPAEAAGLEPVGSASAVAWNSSNFFGPCNGDCAVSIYGGPELKTAMTSVFLIRNPEPIWDWQLGRPDIVAGTFSRRLVTFWNAFTIEPEVGLAQRFHGMQATEVWVGLDLRWTRFPWNNVIKTTVALVEGVNLATQVDTEERIRGHGGGSLVLNYFSPEITFALPSLKQYELIIRLHHRSGMFGLINNVDGGEQFFTVGLRVHL